jgi:hypothetical protein
MRLIPSHDPDVCYNWNGEDLCIYCLNDVPAPPDDDNTPDDEAVFTLDNTEGFSQTECDLMNEAVTMRIRIYGESARMASERVSNRWVDGADLRRLVGCPLPNAEDGE